MKNIIEIEIEFVKNPGQISILHNDCVIAETISPGIIILECPVVNSTNLFEVKSDVEINIIQLSFYGIGKEKLVHQGVCVNDTEIYKGQTVAPGFKWQLQYTWPVFSWLYTVLTDGKGWIVGE